MLFRSSIKFNTPEIEIEFAARKKDGQWKADYVGTETDATAKAWFEQVVEPAAAEDQVEE